MLCYHGDGRQGLFFMPKIMYCPTGLHKRTDAWDSGRWMAWGMALHTITNFKLEVEVVRTKITLACTECQQRNYNLTKDKKTHPERMETKKYCRFCKKHTLHKETK